MSNSDNAMLQRRILRIKDLLKTHRKITQCKKAKLGTHAETVSTVMRPVVVKTYYVDNCDHFNSMRPGPTAQIITAR